MTMNLGLSLYGALQFDDAGLAAIVPQLPNAKVTMIRVGMDWWSRGQAFTLITDRGTLNRAMVPRAIQFNEFCATNGILVHWTLFQSLTDQVKRRNAIAAVTEFSGNLSSAGLGVSECSMDVSNEYFFSLAFQEYPIQDLYRLLEGAKNANPSMRVTFSTDAKDSTANATDYVVKDPRLIAQGYKYISQRAPIDMVCPHPRRDQLVNGNNVWDDNNGRYFTNLKREMDRVGLNVPMWDDEGRREGDQDGAGGRGPDPTVQEHVDAAQGAKDAGCEYHVFHSDMAYGTTLRYSSNEIQKILRIANEVIDGAPPVTPPAPEPEPEDPPGCGEPGGSC